MYEAPVYLRWGEALHYCCTPFVQSVHHSCRTVLAACAGGTGVGGKTQRASWVAWLPPSSCSTFAAAARASAPDGR